jgi:hypothetical protein
MESAVSIYAPSNKQELEATLQNLSADEMSKVSFQWSVKGDFGSISDGRGNTGASFKSAEKKISFTAANAAGLTDGDNWEYVYVTAYLDNQEIGSDTARINVRKTRYEMLPAGVTISGKEGRTNKVNLRLEPVNNGTPIGPNDQTEFKIIWETAGAYGSLNLGSHANAKNVTSYNVGKIQYECVNDEVKNATETITARIFGKKKGASDLEYRLIDIVKGTVKIDNDDKKKILHIPVECAHGDTVRPGNSMTCMITSFVTFKEEKDAKSYSVRFYNIRWPATYSWAAGGNQPSKVSHYVSPTPSGSFKVAYGSSWSIGTPEQIAGKGHFSCNSSSQGMAEVTIILK